MSIVVISHTNANAIYVSLVINEFVYHVLIVGANIVVVIDGVNVGNIALNAGKKIVYVMIYAIIVRNTIGFVPVRNVLSVRVPLSLWVMV